MGTRDGHLYVFAEGSTVLTRSIKAHTGSVYTLHPMGGRRPRESDSGVKDAGWADGFIAGEGLWSGGKDGLVKFYDSEMHGLKEFSVATITSNGAPSGAAGALKVRIARNPSLRTS